MLSFVPTYPTTTSATTMYYQYPYYAMYHSSRRLGVYMGHGDDFSFDDGSDNLHHDDDFIDDTSSLASSSFSKEDFVEGVLEIVCMVCMFFWLVSSLITIMRYVVSGKLFTWFSNSNPNKHNSPSSVEFFVK